MPRRTRSALLAAVLLSLVTGLGDRAMAGAKPSPHPRSKGSAAQERSIADIRRVGAAMSAWFEEQVKGWPTRPHADDDGDEDAPASFTAVPRISRDDLARILVPKYLAAVPERDGWGNPYEYRLETQDLEAQPLMAVRSAGKDGRFSGDRYGEGSFPASREAEDIAWMDGSFVRWPDSMKVETAKRK